MVGGQSIPHLLNRLWRYISARRRKQFGVLLVLMLLSSLAEILSIGSILPFLAVLTSPDRVLEFPVIKPVIYWFDLTQPKHLMLPLTFAFGISILVAGAMRLLLLWVSSRLSFAAGSDLSIDIYRRTLYQSYAVHCSRNSSEIINGITGKANGVIYNILVPVLTLISSGIMLFAILIALLALDPIIALTAFSGFGLIYFIIMRVTRSRLLINSRIYAKESTQVIKSLQEGLGGIRDVLIDGTQEIYCQTYRNADLAQRRVQGENLFVGSSPRYAVEALSMILIATLAYVLAQRDDGIAYALPLLGALALGAQRLLPVSQQAYSAWSSIQSGKFSLQDTLELLDQPLPVYAVDRVAATALPFKSSISLKGLNFRYNLKASLVIKDLNLTIKKGSRVGFIGVTGSGKSTLLDIIMGLLQPTDGSIEVDGQEITIENHRAWQSHIAHVPQYIFLADSSIEENIAFGVPKDQIDVERVRHAARQAQIAENIESWPEQYQTFVGERGIRLSGGQRQRIGIARALYKQADVIIFDEATSALDNETERAVMQAIEGLSQELTLLIIAHRVTTLKNCTQIVELSDGKIKHIDSYQVIESEIIDHPENFK